MPKAVLFDLDGTLIDSRRDIASSVNRMLEDMGFAPRIEEDIYGFIGGGVYKLVLASLPPGQANRVDEGVERFWLIYKDHVLDTTVPYAGIPQSLEVNVRSEARGCDKQAAHARGVDIAGPGALRPVFER